MSREPLPYATPATRSLARWPLIVAGMAIAFVVVAGIAIFLLRAVAVPRAVTPAMPAAVDDTAHLQALLASFAVDPSSKIETLPGSLTGATAADALVDEA